jgi:hypothetical protein
VSMMQRFAGCSRENQRSDRGRYSRLRLAQAGVGLEQRTEKPGSSLLSPGTSSK